jgi:hypothetical protein
MAQPSVPGSLSRLQRLPETFPWIAAVLLGALLPALIAAGLSGDFTLLPATFAITLGHAIILGLPVALFFRAKRWTRLSAVLAAAFLVGAIPLGLPVSFGGRPAAGLADWLAELWSVWALGLLGAIGGFVFWLTLRSCGLLGAESETPSRRWNAALAGFAAVAALAVAAVPQTTKDRSCHNVLRDGRSSAGPSLRVDLDIAMDDWSILTTLVEGFAVSHGMLFRNAGIEKPEVKTLGLSACTEQGLVISAHDQRWAAQKYAPILPGRGVPVSVFDLNGSGAWQPLARALVAAFDSQWPGKVRFFGSDGRAISRSEALPATSP